MEPLGRWRLRAALPIACSPSVADPRPPSPSVKNMHKLLIKICVNMFLNEYYDI